MGSTQRLVATAAFAAACVTGSAAKARFLQVDPVGYNDQVNLYAYVGDDPVNRSDPSGQHGRGDGFTDPEWEKFNKAQQQQAGRFEKAAARLNAAIQTGGKAFRKASGQYERVFGRGTGTAGNMARTAAQLTSMAGALRDNGSQGYIATGLTAEAFAAAGYGPTAMAYGENGGKGMAVNLGHPEFGNRSVLGWAAGHEAGHNFGLSHPPINGVTPYAIGSPAERAAFGSLKTTDPAAAMQNPDELLLYSNGRPPL